MNKEAFKQVLKIVEKSAKAKGISNACFKYSEWMTDRTGEHATVGDIVDHPCGTAGCLGGWGSVLAMAQTPAGRKRPRLDAFDEAGEARACRFYGITRADGNFLFYGQWHRAGMLSSTKDVIAKLKNIISTGKVINPDFDARYQ